MKVEIHPKMNFNIRSGVAELKSLYKMADPTTTERVNITNWVGMTCYLLALVS